MIKNYTTLLYLFIIYLLACCYIAYEGQFLSSYLQSRGLLQDEYQYPWSGVLFCCGLYFFVILNYIPLFTMKFSQNNPAKSYILASIVPIFITLYSLLGAMHASSFWGAFIMVMLVTILVHFFVLPFILKYSNKNLKARNRKSFRSI